MSVLPGIPARDYTKGVHKYKPKVDPSLKNKYGRRRGRPTKGNSLNDFIRISSDLLDMIKSESKRGERLGDTLFRILIEKTQQIASLRQENDRLSS